jgi:hypothetical protein
MPEGPLLELGDCHFADSRRQDLGMGVGHVGDGVFALETPNLSGFLDKINPCETSK